MEPQPPQTAGPAATWDSAYRSGSPHWDIGRPQPAFVRLAGAGAMQSHILDSGCRSGDHALFLTWREKAAECGIAATFVVADVLDLESLGRRFRTVLDTARRQ